MANTVRSLCVLVLVGCFIGCPPASDLPLAGDPRLVGTWAGNVILLTNHVYIQITFDASGNFRTYFEVQEDQSSVSRSGQWYADSSAGLLDYVITSTNPEIQADLGTAKGFYEINGATLTLCGNPVNMDRPASCSAAATSYTITRVQSKSTDNDTDINPNPGTAQDLVSDLF